MSEIGFRQEQKTVERPKSTTVADAKPANETEVCQEQKNVERPVPSPRDPNKSYACSSPPPNQGDTSPPSPGVGVVQILPESKPGTKPLKPQRNFAVRYDPHSTPTAPNVGSLTKPKGSPENETISTTRPVPRPRPRSMIVSRSEPMCISAEQNDRRNNKLSPPFRPEPATRPAPPVTKPSILQPLVPKTSKGYRMVGSSIWYEGDTSVPPQRPPPVKPKPVASPTSNEADKTADSIQPASAKIAPEVVRRKPTIIRPSSSMPSVDQAAGPSASTVNSETTVTATAASNAVASAAETNGWNKPALSTQQSSVNVVGDAGEAAKPQPKKRPTIIRMSRTELSDTTNELPADSVDQKQSQAPPQGSDEVPRKNSDHSNTVVTDVQRSADCRNLTALGRQSVSQKSEDHDLKPVPRSESQPLHLTEQELDRKVPPAKPPQPQASSTAEEQKTTV